MSTQETNVGIQIAHEDLPLTRSNALERRRPPEQIADAVTQFASDLRVMAGDDSLSVTKGVSNRERETIYFIRSALDRPILVKAIEKTLSNLNIGGTILTDGGEVRPGPSPDRFIDDKFKK